MKPWPAISVLPPREPAFSTRDDLRAVLGHAVMDAVRPAPAAAGSTTTSYVVSHIFNGRASHRDGLERFHVAARLRHAVRNGGQDGVGGVGRTGHSIYREGLVFHDGGRDLRDRTIGQAGGLAVNSTTVTSVIASALQSRDGPTGPLLPCASSGVSALGVGQRHRAGHHHHEETPEGLLW